MFRPVFLVSVCAVGAAAVHPISLAFAGSNVPSFQRAIPVSSSIRPALRSGATQLRAADDVKKGWGAQAKQSITASLFAASVALSGFSGLVPAAPVHAELAPEATKEQAGLFSGNILLAEDGAPALKMPDVKMPDLSAMPDVKVPDLKIPKPGDDIKLPTGGSFKFGGDPNTKVDIGGGLGGSSTTGSKTKKYDFSGITEPKKSPTPAPASSKVAPAPDAAAPAADAPKAADAPSDAPKPKKKKAAPAPDAAAPAADAPKAADAPSDAPKPKKKKAACAAPAADAPKAVDSAAKSQKKAPIDRAGAEAKAKAAADKVKAEKQKLAELKAKIKAEEKAEKEAEKAADAAKKAACEGQLICIKAITGF